MSGVRPPRGTPPENAAAENSDEGDRPTLVPEFNLQDFARDSEIRPHAAPVNPGEPTIDEARRLHLEGDNEGALVLLTRLLEAISLHPEATRLAEVCRAALERECLEAVGSTTAVLVPALSVEELKGFSLDHVSGYLVSLMDGALNVEDILDVTGLPRILVLRHLRSLVERGLVCTASRRRPSPPFGTPDFHSERAGEEDRNESSAVSARRGMPSLGAVPVLRVARERLDELDMDPHARALVALVDDRATVAEILRVANTDIATGQAFFQRLVDDAIVAFF